MGAGRVERSKNMARQFKVGDLVRVKGSGAAQTPFPVRIVDFGEKNDQPVADLEDGQWAYVDELVFLSPAIDRTGLRRLWKGGR
jgi:hypothetical protein